MIQLALKIEELKQLKIKANTVLYLKKAGNGQPKYCTKKSPVYKRPIGFDF